MHSILVSGHCPPSKFTVENALRYADPRIVLSGPSFNGNIKSMIIGQGVRFSTQTFSAVIVRTEKGFYVA